MIYTVPPKLSEAEETAIRSFSKNLGTQLGIFVSSTLSDFLTLMVALGRTIQVIQTSEKSKNIATSLNKDRLLNAADVADRLKISKSKAYQLLQSRKIPCLRIGRTTRVKQEDLEEYIKRNTQ